MGRGGEREREKETEREQTRTSAWTLLVSTRSMVMLIVENALKPLLTTPRTYVVYVYPSLYELVG